jgi:DNA-binding response OmpR family regulator
MTPDIFAQQDTRISTLPSKKVLLVDEEAGDLKILRLTLEGQGFEVFACTSFEAGMRCLDAETFDFVVVSQGTQAFEGRDVVDRALQLNRHRPVLVLTRCVSMRCYLEAMQMGAIDYLEKPIPPLDLLRFVQAHTSCAELLFRGTAV